MALSKRLLEPVDIAPLVFFRILGGLLMTVTMAGELLTDFRLLYLQHPFHFSYLFFPWLGPWPAAMMVAHFGANVILAILVTIGLHYRISAGLLFLGSGTLFLMEKASYINHLYLYVLIAFLLIFLPANRELSVDVQRRPSIRKSYVPAWTIGLLVFQISVVYLYGGIAKLNTDWLHALPLKVWLAPKADYPIIGPWLAWDGAPWIFAYGGLGFDLLIVPAMLWSRTRKAAFGVSVLFHLTNLVVFHVGTFPFFALVMTALYFPPDRFRRLPILRKFLGPIQDRPTPPARSLGRRVVVGLVLYAAIQILVPLRHFLYPGRPDWTEEGHRFAWHMMVRAKSGLALFTVEDTDTGQKWRENALDYMPRRAYGDMLGKPDMILEFAHHLGRVARKNGHENVEVRCVCRVSLNGRPRQPIVDPKRNLLVLERSLSHYDWIVPLED